MQSRSSTPRLLLLFFACLVHTPIHAQQKPSLPDMPVTSAVFQGRIVDECEINRAETRCTPIPEQNSIINVTLEVPDFEPADAHTDVYIVTAINANGSDSGAVEPDRYGIVQYQVRTGVAGASGDPWQYYLTATNLDTRETRVTFDIHEVKLLPFLTSLNAVLNLTRRLRPPLRVKAGTGRPVVNVDMLSRYQDHRVSIRGENLTIDEILDELYRNTGCTVNEDARRLVLANCR